MKAACAKDERDARRETRPGLTIEDRGEDGVYVSLTRIPVEPTLPGDLFEAGRRRRFAFAARAPIRPSHESTVILAAQRRDGGCTVPGCGRRGKLHGHHVLPRSPRELARFFELWNRAIAFVDAAGLAVAASPTLAAEGGPDEDWNVTTICKAHHDLVHDWRLIVVGRAPDALRWFILEDGAWTEIEA